MSPEELKEILLRVKNGKLNVDEALKELKELPFKDLGHTKIDLHRSLRTGYPEVIFSPGKTIEQIEHIVSSMLKGKNNILCTRADEEIFIAVKKLSRRAEYNRLARTISIIQKKSIENAFYIYLDRNRRHIGYPRGRKRGMSSSRKMPEWAICWHCKCFQG